MINQDKKFLKKAIGQARISFKQGGFPAGAIIVKDGAMISNGISIGSKLNDPTEHSETSAIRKACQKLRTVDLSGCILYAALEPCLMCFSVANWAGISRIVYGCRKTDEMAKKNFYEGLNKINDINSNNNHHIKLEFIDDFENEVLKIIEDWEKHNY